MIIAMVAVRMVQVAIDQIVDVVAMRHRFVTASGPMLVVGIVTSTAMIRCATIRVL